MSVVARDFIQFVNNSPSPFHAVATCVKWLKNDGFVQLKESEDWSKQDLKAGGKYFFTRNFSTLVCFAVGEKYEAGNGFNILGAHTDSPCLKVKPHSKITKEGYLELGVQTYGGGLWHTWFDRDLALAGRVIVHAANGKFEQKLVFLNRPIARIPTLAIHLDRGVREKFSFNTETQLLPVIATVVKGVLENESESDHHPILLKALAEELKCKVTDIRDFELCLCDAQPATLGGLQKEFIFSPRLDNLMSCWVGLQSLLKSLPTLETESRVRLAVFFDNEEVGSQSMMGADSTLLNTIIDRIDESFGPKNANNAAPVNLSEMTRRNSFIISADMAHACHPNYASKHESNHRPQMHQGWVIKVNANQRYATTAVGAFLIKELAKRRNIPVQEFVVRNDSPCGSTIGPMSAAHTGIRTLDIGGPQLSMHSIREMCATSDCDHAVNLFEAFWNQFTELDKELPDE